MNEHIDKELRSILENIFFEMRGSNPEIDYERLKEDFVFQMIESMEPLKRYVKLCESPHDFDFASAESIVQGVLYDAVGHLISACRKYGLLLDPFREMDQQPEDSPTLKE
jgi:hypothetical protein